MTGEEEIEPRWARLARQARKQMEEARLREAGGKPTKPPWEANIREQPLVEPGRSEQAKWDSNVTYNPDAFRIVKRSEARKKENREPVKAYGFPVPKTPQIDKYRWAVKCPVKGCDWEDQWFPNRPSALKAGNKHVVALHATPRSK